MPIGAAAFARHPFGGLSFGLLRQGIEQGESSPVCVERRATEGVSLDCRIQVGAGLLEVFARGADAERVDYVRASVTQTTSDDRVPVLLLGWIALAPYDDDAAGLRASGWVERHISSPTPVRRRSAGIVMTLSRRGSEHVLELTSWREED